MEANCRKYSFGELHRMTCTTDGQNYHSYSTTGLREDMIATATSTWTGCATSSRNSIGRAGLMLFCNLAA
eukprot:7697374-Pyramimonas_sp.AAC.1